MLTPLGYGPALLTWPSNKRRDPAGESDVAGRARVKVARALERRVGSALERTNGNSSSPRVRADIR